jgi:hypothetical protein
MEAKQILLKHSMSGAQDAMTEYVINHDLKFVMATMDTHLEKPFISSSLLIRLAQVIERDDGVIAYNNDDVDSFQPVLANYTVIVTCGDVYFRADIWRQRMSQWDVQLFPVDKNLLP